jgi:hypothetical protein
MITQHIREWIFIDAVLINVTHFDQAPSDFQHCYRALPYFFKHVLQKHKMHERIVKSLPNVYLLVGKKRSERLVRPNEKKWSDVLNRDMQSYMDHYGVVPLGFAVIYESAPYYISLQWIETLVAGENLGTHMIRSFEKKFNRPVIPMTVEYSFDYWVKYFIYFLGCSSSREIRQFLQNTINMQVSTIKGHRDLQIAIDIAQHVSESEDEVSSE